MIEGPHLHVGRDRFVADHEVERLHCQVRQQPLRMVLPTHESHRLRQSNRRLEQPVGNQLGDHVGHAHHEARLPARRVSADRGQQVATEREDLVGIEVHLAANVGEHQAPPTALEELLPQLILEHTQLATQSGLCQAQLSGCGRYAACAGDRPEVQKVMVIEPLHRTTILSVFSIWIRQIIYLSMYGDKPIIAQLNGRKSRVPPIWARWRDEFQRLYSKSSVALR